MTSLFIPMYCLEGVPLTHQEFHSFRTADFTRFLIVIAKLSLTISLINQPGLATVRIIDTANTLNLIIADRAQNHFFMSNSCCVKGYIATKAHQRVKQSPPASGAFNYGRRSLRAETHSLRDDRG